MYIAHIAYSEKGECCSEMARFEGRRLPSKLLMGGWEFHWWDDDQFLGLRIYLLHRYGGHKAIGSLNLKMSQSISA